MWLGVALVGLSIIVIAASIVAPGVVGADGSGSDILTGGDQPPAGDELNETHVEQLVVKELNRERARRDRGRLGTTQRLSTVADSYSQTMVEYGDSGHELGGTTPQERYQQGGVTCQYTGENAAKTWYQTEIDTLDGTRHYRNASELARGLVEHWLRSPPHRQIMLSPEHSAVGVGISITWEDDAWAVYAVTDFCR
jgi:uncharacterized protein YkwD